MTEITLEGDIKLEVMSTDIEGRQKCKRHNEQLTWDLKKWKIKKLGNKLKTEKVYMPNEWLLKNFFKKEREKRTRKCGRKKKKKENEGQYAHFLFLFQWLWSLGLTHVFCCIILLNLYCWKFCCSVRREEERHSILRK